MRNKVFAALLLWWTFSLYGEVKVLEDFTLIDGTGCPPATHVSMIVDSGRIRWVGPAAQIRMPDGAEKINLAGKFVMPGSSIYMVISGTPWISRRTRNSTRAKASIKI
jgi:hypothetical protein